MYVPCSFFLNGCLILRVPLRNLIVTWGTFVQERRYVKRDCIVWLSCTVVNDESCWSWCKKPTLSLSLSLSLSISTSPSLAFFQWVWTYNFPNVHNYSWSTLLRYTVKISASVRIMRSRIESPSSAAILGIQFKNFSRIYWRKVSKLDKKTEVVGRTIEAIYRGAGGAEGGCLRDEKKKVEKIWGCGNDSR